MRENQAHIFDLCHSVVPHVLVLEQWQNGLHAVAGVADL